MEHLLGYHSSKLVGIEAVRRCEFDQHGVERKLREFWMYEAIREHIECRTIEFVFGMMWKLLSTQIWLYKTQE